MKASTHTTNPPHRHASEIAKWIGLLFLAGLLASCGSVSSGSSTSTPVSIQSSHWFKVKEQPATYFPKGIPADHPTTVGDGMWVTTGDAVGTRYFIPLRGVNTNALVAEAQSAMTPEKRRQMARGRSFDKGDLANAAASVFGNGALGMGEVLMEVDRLAGFERKGGGLWDQPLRR